MISKEGTFTMESPLTTHVQITDLASLPAGAQGILHAMQVGRGVASRLATLGFTLGTEVAVIQNYGSGPILVLVRGTRVALGRGQARQILISGRGDAL
jgi:ferrous iron transport protein A